MFPGGEGQQRLAHRFLPARGSVQESQDDMEFGGGQVVQLTGADRLNTGEVASARRWVGTMSLCLP